MLKIENFEWEDCLAQSRQIAKETVRMLHHFRRFSMLDVFEVKKEEEPRMDEEGGID